MPMTRDERRMTFIVVPHGGRDLSTRSFEISYRRLRIAGILLVAAVVVWLAMAASWIYVAGQAARVQLLESQVTRLESENAQVSQLAESLQRLEAQYEQVRQMFGANQKAPGSIWLPLGDEQTGTADSAGLAWPLTQRGFVTQEHLGKIPGSHPGIDIAVAEGSYVRTAAAGVVTEAGENPVYGKFVRIRHSGGYETVYAHASELFVTNSDSVSPHQVIALSGNTGSSTAPHLHFEIWKDGRALDPLTIVTQPE